MMTINDDNIESAFKKMEKGFSESGVEPMDSYVVDDGWNNYNNSNTTSTVHDVALALRNGVPSPSRRSVTSVAAQVAR